MIADFKTLPELLDRIAQRDFGAGAIHFKRDGQWRSLTPGEFARRARRIALGLRALGLRDGDRVGILAPSSPSWSLFDFGILAARGVVVPLFSNLSHENLEFEVTEAGVRFLLVQGGDQLAALGPLVDRFERIVSVEPVQPGERLLALEDLEILGAERDESEYAALASSVRPDDLATIIYTSGSMGVPKGVCLTHANFASQVRAAGERFPLDPSTDIVLTCLPLAHVFERMVLYFFLAAGVPVHFAEDITKLGDALREVRPTIITLVPRLLQKVLDRLEMRAAEEKGARGVIARAALRHARRAPCGHRGLLGMLFGALVYRKIREGLGGRIRIAVAGGSALPAELERVFVAFGLPLYQGYGMTEAAPVIAANAPGRSRPESVGHPFPGVEVRIAEDGEILARGPGVMQGYWAHPEETSRTIDSAGWLHTGDLGRIDRDGFVFITGRKKDLCKTAGGKYVAVPAIEGALAASKLIEHAVVVAEDRKYVSALLVPDFARVSAWLARRMPGTTMEEYLASDDWRQKIGRHVDAVNSRLNEWEKVRKWAVIPRPLSIEGGEITPTLKVRRSAVVERFRDVVDKLYFQGSS